MRRVQQLVPGLIGLGIAATLLWQGGAALERNAEGHESFSVRVEEPAKVVPLAEVGSRVAPGADPRWRGQVRPLADLARLEFGIDGRPPSIEPALDPSTGGLAIDLSELSGAPGWHFVELELERRGGRRTRIVDPVLVGRFADATATATATPGGDRACAATFTASPALVHSLVIPILERELLPALRANEHMGPDTRLARAELELGDDVVRFELEVAGVNTLAVSGIVAVAIVDERELYAELVTLSEVDFRGKVRDTARGVGAGGGALIGGLISGPLAPVGAAAGYFLADRFVTKKAREVVREQVEAGLAQLEGRALLPELVELVPGRPQSRVALGFCEQTRVRSTGLIAGLWLAPRPGPGGGGGGGGGPGLGPPFDLGVPGPLVTAAIPTIEALGADEDLRVELTIDAVNAFLHTWTASGLLAELIGEQRALDHANAELEAWTPLRLRSLRPTRPPVLSPAGGPDGGWAYGVGGLMVELGGVDEQPWGDVSVAAAGSLSPHWDPETGELSLTGALDRLDSSCTRPVSTRDADADADADAEADPGTARLLDGCFVELLEAVEVRDRIDAHLRPGARGLPKIALRELLVDELALELGALAFSRPQPGLLRLSASLTGSGSNSDP